MNLTFTEEQEILRKFAADFLNEKFPKKYLRELEATYEGYVPQIWKEMADLGWMGLPFPDKYGGTGMNVLDQMVLLEEMGKASAQSPYFATVILGAFPIYEFGNEEQRQKYIPGVISGKLILTFALNEDENDFSQTSFATNAIRSGDAWIINGTKLFVPFAHVANYILCVARTDDTDRDASLTIFIIDRNLPGVSCEVMDSIAGKPCQVTFKDVKVGSDSILGDVNHAGPYLKKIFNRAEIAICSEMAGLGQQVLDMTVQYSKDRKQFGRAIGSFQIIQHYAADMFIELDGIKLNAYKAAWKLCENLPCDEEVAMAKAWAIQAAEKIIGAAHQIHGAIGSTIEYDLHYYTRRLKAHSLTFGDTKYYREIIAKLMEL